MAVAEILAVPRVRFRRVIGRAVGGGFECRAAIQVERDVTAQADGARDVRTRRELHGASAGRRSGFDGFVDGIAIGRLAVAFRAEGLHVEGGAVCREREQENQRIPSHSFDCIRALAHRT
jgi:hypothetical protein